MKLPNPALDAASLRKFEERERLFRAEALAEPDHLLQPYRILKWVAERLGLKLGDVTVRRYPDAAAPGVNGFHWRGSKTLYLAKSSGPRSLIHEFLHLARPDLCEYAVMIRAAHLDRELKELLDEPVATMSTLNETERNAKEWVY